MLGRAPEGVRAHRAGLRARPGPLLPDLAVHASKAHPLV